MSPIEQAVGTAGQVVTDTVNLHTRLDDLITQLGDANALAPDRAQERTDRIQNIQKQFLDLQASIERSTTNEEIRGKVDTLRNALSAQLPRQNASPVQQNDQVQNKQAVDRTNTPHTQADPNQVQWAFQNPTTIWQRTANALAYANHYVSKFFSGARDMFRHAPILGPLITSIATSTIAQNLGFGGPVLQQTMERLLQQSPLLGLLHAQFELSPPIALVPASTDTDMTRQLTTVQGNLGMTPEMFAAALASKLRGQGLTQVTLAQCVNVAQTINAIPEGQLLGAVPTAPIAANTIGLAGSPTLYTCAAAIQFKLDGTPLGTTAMQNQGLTFTRTPQGLQIFRPDPLPSATRTPITVTAHNGPAGTALRTFTITF